MVPSSDKKDAKATAAWEPFTLGNLGTALAWYRRQELRRRCPDYDTLEQTDPRAAAALLDSMEEVGQMLLVDLANPALIAELVSKHPWLDPTTLTLKQAISFEQSRLRRIGMEEQGLKLKDTRKAQICMVRGERAHSRRRSAPVARPAGPARPSGALACSERLGGADDVLEARRLWVRSRLPKRARAAPARLRCRADCLAHRQEARLET